MPGLIAAAAAVVFGAAPAQVSPDSVAAAEIVRRCERVTARVECAAAPLLEIARRDGAGRAMLVLDAISETSTMIARDAHGLAHRIGIAAYRSPETLAQTFASCPPTSQAGCYHGVLQGYFTDLRRTRTTLTTQLLDAACAPHAGAANNLQFQCVHGLGHGVMAYHDNDLHRSLEACDLLTQQAQQTDCYAGAFMENIVLATHPHHAGTAAAGGSDDHSHHAHHAGSAGAVERLKHSDHLYPCSAVADRYRGACYTMHSSAMLYLNGSDLAATAADCRRAPQEHTRACLYSLGRDVFALAVGEKEKAARLCASLAPLDAEECVAGVALAMTNVRSEPGDGIAFCQAVGSASQKKACYEAVGRTLLTLVATPQQRIEACSKVEAPYPMYCAGAAHVPTPTESAGSPASGSQP